MFVEMNRDTFAHIDTYGYTSCTNSIQSRYFEWFVRKYLGNNLSNRLLSCHRSSTSQPANRSGAPYPSVVFAGGLMGINSVYTWIGDALAGKGYVVVVVQVPNITGSDVQQWADSIKDGISYLQMQHSGFSDLAGMVSGVFGAAGDSMGGAASLLAASQDNRIRAVVSMAPPSPTSPPEPCRL